MSASIAETTRVVDSSTGEVVREVVHSTQVIPAKDEPDYVKLYVRAWCEFKGLEGLRESDKDVFVQLLPVMTYAKDNQIIYTNSALRREIARRVGIKTIDNALTRLVHAGVLKRVARGTFSVNPELVGKGSWGDIKTFRATFNVLGPDAGTVTVNQE